MGIVSEILIKIQIDGREKERRVWKDDEANKITGRASSEESGRIEEKGVSKRGINVDFGGYLSCSNM